MSEPTPLPTDLNELEQLQVASISSAGGDPANWFAPNQIVRARRLFEQLVAAQSPDVRPALAENTQGVLERMSNAAERAFSRFERLDRFAELLSAQQAVEEAFARLRRKGALWQPRVPYLIGTLDLRSLRARTRLIAFPDDPFLRELIIFDAGFFSLLSMVSQAICYLLGGEEFNCQQFLNCFVERTSLAEGLHSNDRAVRLCADALDAFDRGDWVSPAFDPSRSHDFLVTQEAFLFNPMLRFVFAHEFAHLSGDLHGGESQRTQHNREHVADTMAFSLMIDSSHHKEIPWAFTMWPIWVLFASFRALTAGMSYNSERPTASHPTSEQRLAYLEKVLVEAAQGDQRVESMLPLALKYNRLAYEWTLALFDQALALRRRNR